MGYDLKVLTGNTNKKLAEEICDHLDTHLCRATVESFPGGETNVQIEENVRGSDVYIVQSVCENAELGLSPNDVLMEFLILLDAARPARQPDPGLLRHPVRPPLFDKRLHRLHRPKAPGRSGRRVARRREHQDGQDIRGVARCRSGRGG